MTQLIKSLSVFIENSKVASGMTQCTYPDNPGKSKFCHVSFECTECSMSLVNKELIGDMLDERVHSNTG